MKFWVSKQQQRKYRQSFRPRLEVLEERRLLAVTSQTINPVPAMQAVDRGNVASMDVFYNVTTDDGNPNSAGLGLRVHFNSALLGATPTVTNRLNVGIALPNQIQTDVGAGRNFDNDASTDMFVLLAWATTDTSFPVPPGSGNTLPIRLVTVNFTTNAAVVGSQTSTINFTRSSPAPASPPTFVPTSGMITVQEVNVAPVFGPPAGPFNLPENSANGAAVATITATDSNAGQTVSFAITGGNTGNAFAIAANTGALTVADGSQLNFEGPNASYTLQVTASDTGNPILSTMQGFVVNLTNVNEPPVSGNQMFSINESVNGSIANGTAVGTVAATDPDSTNLTFAITAGNSNNAFAINASTGQITVNNQAALNFETDPTYILNVSVTDDGNPNLSANPGPVVTINLNNVNELPTIADQAFAVNENSPNGTIVGNVVATDPDAGTVLTFAITGGNTAGAFNINPTTGQIAVGNSLVLDFETTPAFPLTVQVTDNGNPALSSSATVTINLNNTSDPPVVNNQAFTIDENSPNGTVVGTVAVSDQDAGQTHQFIITLGNAAGAFAINANTGQITVANAAQLNFETSQSFALTVMATDNGAPPLSDNAIVTINLNDLNEFAPVVTDATFALLENVASSTPVGTVVATDGDTQQTLTFSITAGNTAGAFAINPITGQITVANAAAVNFEVNPVFMLMVQATDNGVPARSGTGTVTVNLTNANDPPVVGDLPFALDENSAAGTVVGTVFASDEDFGAVLAFSITDGNQLGAFAINPATGQITVASAAPLDFEFFPAFMLTVQVSDGAATDTAIMTINLNDVNEAPVVLDQSFSIDENSAIGTVVGTIVANDFDFGQLLSFSPTTSGPFNINATTGEITIANAAALNFEANPTLSFTVTVSDAGNPPLNDTALITINLNDLNEAPVVLDQTFTIAENSANATVVGTIAATDVDAGSTRTFAPTTSGPFAINATTGQITVTNVALLDFETTPSFSFTTTVTDNGNPGLTDTATVTINLTNVNEAPVVIDQTFAIAENSANTTVVGTIAATDVDAGSTRTFSPTTSGPFAINATTGQITVTNTAALDFETTPSFMFTVTVTDNGNPALNDTAMITVNLTNVVEQLNEISAVGADAGGTPQVRVFDSVTGAEKFNIFAFAQTFLGGVHVAVGEVTGDTFPDIIVGAGPSLINNVGTTPLVGPKVKVFSGANGSLVREFDAYDVRFLGGVFVAVADVNGDGQGDIITGADAGGGPHVKVFSFNTLALLHDFYAYAAGFGGGVRVAGGDINGDMRADVITGSGAGNSSHIRVFSGAGGGQLASTLGSFVAYTPDFMGGVYVAAGDVNRDGRDDIITGAGQGGGPHVKVYNSATGAELHSFYAYTPTFTGGVRVGATDDNGDGAADVIVGPGPGAGPQVRILNGTNLAELDSFFAFAQTFTGGVFVGSRPRNPAPLRAANGPAVDIGEVDTLTLDDLNLALAAAIQHWQAAGYDTSLFSQVQADVADLPGDLLGLAFPNNIRIDDDAAGYGYGPGGIDLETVVAHELGHVLGLDDLDADQYGADLMADYLAAGVDKVFAPTLAALDDLFASDWE